MYGEKFLEKKVEGNKVIRISEFKEFNHNYLDLIQDLNDYVTDDWETQCDNGIYWGRDEDFNSFDANLVLNWVEELVEEKKEDEEEEEDYIWLSKWIKPLKEAKEFTIYLRNNNNIHEE